MDHKQIKSKIKNLNSKIWWGDDFDVRFYLINKVEHLKKKIVLDLGGGVGIICSEMNEDNFRINLDLSLDDLKLCKKNLDPNIEKICASMIHLPFKENSFDIIICSHLIEVAKATDIEQNNVIKNKNVKTFPTVEKVFSNILNVIKNDGTLFLTTPNNLRYKSIKLDYYELKNSLKNYFSQISLEYYNTLPKLSKKYRKLNMANIIPKILSKIVGFKEISNSLAKSDQGIPKESVSFFVKCSNDRKGHE